MFYWITALNDFPANSWFYIYITNEGHRELNTSFLAFINIAIPDNIYNNDPNFKVDLIIF